MINLNGLHRSLPKNKKRKTDYWTPPEIITALGGFDFDPCTSQGAVDFQLSRGVRIPAYLTAAEDGLAPRAEWKGRVWMNPPYGLGIKAWIERFCKHGKGTCLVPASSTETEWGQLILMHAWRICFLKKRIAFYESPGVITDSTFVNSMLVAIGDIDDYMLSRARFAGVYFKASDMHIK